MSAMLRRRLQPSSVLTAHLGLTLESAKQGSGRRSRIEGSWKEIGTELRQSQSECQGREFIRGLGWSASSALLQQLLQFGFSIALARILVPHDFGLIASVYVFVGFASLFVDSGFGWAIVQRTTLTQRHLSSAFWLNVAIGTGMMILTVAFAPLLALFFDDSQLLPLTIALSPAFLIGLLAGVRAPSCNEA